MGLGESWRCFMGLGVVIKGWETTQGHCEGTGGGMGAHGHFGTGEGTWGWKVMAELYGAC